MSECERKHNKDHKENSKVLATFLIKGRRDNIPPNAQRKVGEVEICGVYVWIYTDAVQCDEQGRPPEDRRQMFVIIMECVSWVWDDTLWEYEWATEPNVLWKENEILETLNYEIDAPARSNGYSYGSIHRQYSTENLWILERKLLNVEKTANNAIEITRIKPSNGLHTSRTCCCELLRWNQTIHQTKTGMKRTRWKYGFWANARVCRLATMPVATPFFEV